MSNIVQERNAEMVHLLQQDFLPLIDRNHFADYYGSVPETGVGSPATTLTLNTTRFNTASAYFDLQSSVLTVLQDGLYRIDYWATVGFDGGFVSDLVAMFWLEEDPATGSFAEVPGSRCHLHLPFTEGVTGMRSVSLRVPVNYRYRLRFQRLAGANTLRSFANGKGLTITCLFAVK